MRSLFMMTHQEFYRNVRKYVVPFLQAGGPNGGARKPHRMTPDAMLAMLILKCHENPNNRFLGFLIGESRTAACNWLNNLRNYIYQNDQWIRRQQNLSNPK